MSSVQLQRVGHGEASGTSVALHAAVSASKSAPAGPACHKRATAGSRGEEAVEKRRNCCLGLLQVYIGAAHLTCARAGQHPGCTEQPVRVDTAHTKGAGASRKRAVPLWPAAQSAHGIPMIILPPPCMHTDALAHQGRAWRNLSRDLCLHALAGSPVGSSCDHVRVEMSQGGHRRRQGAAAERCGCHGTSKPGGAFPYARSMPECCQAVSSSPPAVKHMQAVKRWNQCGSCWML